MAGLSASFAGFATIVVAFRSAVGGEISARHLGLVRVFLTTGMSAAAFALLPSLVWLFGDGQSHSDALELSEAGSRVAAVAVRLQDHLESTDGNQVLPDIN